MSVPQIELQAMLRQGFGQHQQGNLAAAETVYEDVLRHQADNFDALHLLGVVAFQTQRIRRAVDLLQMAVAIDQTHAPAHGNLGNALQGSGRHDEAIANYDKAIALDPEFADAFGNRGGALRQLKRYEEAVASCDKAIALRPDYMEAHANRGSALCDLNRPDEAIASCDKAIALAPDYVDAYRNRGTALHDLQRHDEAIACLDRAIALDPENADAHWNQSLCYLQIANFEAGWDLHEWRWRGSETAPARVYDQPLWLGKEDISGKTLFVHWEQGLGDTIHFCRYVYLLKARGVKTILQVQQPLLSLLKQLGDAAEIVGPDEIIHGFDFHCPLMSLPLAFHTDFSNIPVREPYLKSDPGLRNQWAARLGPKQKPRIGLVWSGNADHIHDRKRSLRLGQLSPMLSDRAEFIALQKDVRKADLEFLRQEDRVTFFGDELDFINTAAVIDLVDIVISVDTSIAHLAGAMGKPVWVLLGYNPDWRWLVDRDDSPWYPSARLFRQPRIGDWDNVIKRVEYELSTLS